MKPLVVAPPPSKPSPAESEQHRITHLPFRGWCRECLMGRGLGEARGRRAGRHHEVPLAGVDYFYVAVGGLLTRRGLKACPATDPPWALSPLLRWFLV